MRPPDDDGKATMAGADTAWDEAPGIGDRLAGTYELRELIGQGGMAWVFEAFDHDLRRSVAIKVPRGAQVAAFLVEEARALAAIRHPSLVTVHALGRRDGRPFLVMEHIRGLSLGDHLDRRAEAEQPFTIEEVLTLGETIAEGLAAIHAAGVAHRDVKPDNIMLAGSRVVIMDFGLVLPEYAAASPRMIVGSPAYMAPELVLNQMARGEAYLTDLYALGIVLFELLTLDVPFDGATPTEMAMQHVKEPVPDVGRRRADTPPLLAELVTDLLAKEPAGRPHTADEVVWRLRRARTEKVVPRFSRRVLVVSAEPRTRFETRRLVEAWSADLEVVEVRDADEAIHRAENEPFDLVLIDLGAELSAGIEQTLVLGGSPELERCAMIAVGVVSAGEIPMLEGLLGVRELVPVGPTFDIDLAHALNRTLGHPAQGAEPR